MSALIAEAVRSIYGAYRLARLDTRGLAAFNTSVDGAWRSFFAAVIIAPVYFGILATSPRLFQLDADPTRFWTVQLIAYVISWVAFPVMMAALTEALGRGERFIAYLVVYNWAAVIQSAVLLPIEILRDTALLPRDLADLLWIVGFGAVLAYFWYIARTLLAISPLAAMGIVGLDLAIGVLISIFARTLY